MAMRWESAAQTGMCADVGFAELVQETSMQVGPTTMNIAIMKREGDVKSMECAQGELNVYVLGAASMGAGPDECSELCTTQMGMNWITGAETGSCHSAGFNVFVNDVSLQQGPVTTDIMIMGKRASDTCHCHSYEEIKCNASGMDLYDEHIVEIENYCQGVVAGTASECPYKCFQPFEVLHLHYLECNLRPKHELFLRIHQTMMCHKASQPPAQTDCPAVDVDGGNDTTSAGECVTIPRAIARRYKAKLCGD